MTTNGHVDAQQMLLGQLDLAANVFAEGLSDLTEQELATEMAPATTPNEALRLAIAAIESAIPLFSAGPSRWSRLWEQPDLREQLRERVRLLLNIVSEAETGELDRILAEPIELDMNWPAVTSAAEAIWNITAHLAILAGDISVTRAALGKPEQSWQRGWPF